MVEHTRRRLNRCPSQLCRSILASKPALCCTNCSKSATSSAGDAAGRTVIQLAADDRLLDQLMMFDADAEDLEDGGDAEDDGPAALSFDRVPARRVYRGRQYFGSR